MILLAVDCGYTLRPHRNHDERKQKFPLRKVRDSIRIYATLWRALRKRKEKRGRKHV